MTNPARRDNPHRRPFGPAAAALSLALVAVAAALAGCFQARPAASRRTAPEGGVPGSRLTRHTPWAGWDDAREPLVDFSRLGGWSVTAEVGDVAFRREGGGESEPYCGALWSTSTVAPGRVVLRPPEPVAVTEPADAVEFWVGSRRATNAPPAAGRAPSVGVLVRDAKGRARRLEMGPVDIAGRRLAHLKLNGPDRLDETPWHFEGIDVSGWDRPADARLFFNALTFYLEHRTPTRPARLDGGNDDGWTMAVPVDPPPSSGLRADSVVPPPNGAVRSAARCADDGTCELAWSLGSRRVVYRFQAGRLGDGVEARAGPVGGRAVRLAFPGLEGGAGELRSAFAEAGVIRLSYHSGLDVSAALAGPALTMSFRSRTEKLTGLDVRPATDDGASGVELPYLNDAPAAARPPLLAWRGRDGAPPLFASIVLDPAVSRAARWEIRDRDRPGAGAWTARYAAPAGGRPPLLRERLVLTASDRIEDVLPSLPVANDEKPADLRVRAWFDGRGIDGARRAGVERALAGYGLPVDELAWLRAAYPGWTQASAFLRDDAFDPDDPYWMRDAVRRDAAGQWVPGDRPGTWRVKAAYVRSWLESDPLIELADGGAAASALFAPVAARAPWAWEDLDGRSPGAAQFRWSWLDLGAAFRSVSARVGPLAGDDAGTFFTAGWTAVTVTSDDRGRRLLARPPLPLFVLHRLGAQTCILGPLQGTDASPELPAPRPDAPYPALAAHVAYGWTPLWRPELDPAAAVRAHRMLRPLAARCWGRPVEEAAFESGGRLRPAADAVADGSWASGRLYVRYAGGLELWVNAAGAAEWNVQVGAEDWVLPPAGWLAVGRDLVAASAWAGGRRVDYVAEPDAVYYDGHGSAEPFRGIRSAGAFRLRASAGGGATVLRFGDGAAELAFAAGAVPGRLGEPGRRAFGRDRSGAESGALALAQADGWVRMTCSSNTAEVTIR